MLENRSFDPHAGLHEIPDSHLNGIDGTQWNPEDASNPVVRVQVRMMRVT